MAVNASAGYSQTDRPRGADLDLCTRCGMCEMACPTYRLLRIEPDSPRGRVFLMKQVAVGEADVGAHLAEHLYVCLGCRACETACPSGVPYGRLLELGRFQVEEQRGRIGGRWGWRAFRKVAFEWVLPRPMLFWLAMLPAIMLQRAPRLQTFLLRLPLGERARRLIAMIPPVPRGAIANVADRATLGPMQKTLESDEASLEVGPRDARSATFARVALFDGCVMRALFGHVNDATRRLLERSGCEVVPVRGQWCCGALNMHAGERRGARRMARRNIEAFEHADVEAVIVNSAGCGAVLKEYGELLADDPRYAQRAKAFAAKVRDFSEFVFERGPEYVRAGEPERVTYQDPCHLAHGQRIRRQPRALIRSAGAELVEMEAADRCCGAAGVYSLTHSDLSRAILAEKLEAVDHTGAHVVVTLNPGCHMQLHAGAVLAGKPWRVVHLAELLDAGVSSA